MISALAYGVFLLVFLVIAAIAIIADPWAALVHMFIGALGFGLIAATSDRLRGWLQKVDDRIDDETFFAEAKRRAGVE